MKLYMLKRTRLDGTTAYRATGVDDKWTACGKCWSGGSFKSFLNYSNLVVEYIVKDAVRYNIVVVEINLKNKTIEEVPVIAWLNANTKVKL
jgi:hypothetical protein